jgi:hypothetical protein
MGVTVQVAPTSVCRQPTKTSTDNWTASYADNYHGHAGVAGPIEMMVGRVLIKKWTCWKLSA